MEKSTPLSPILETPTSGWNFGQASTPTDEQKPASGRSFPQFAKPQLRQPWRHSVSTEGGTRPLSRTVREFKPDRQRRRLFVSAVGQWVITVLLCGVLAGILGGFGSLRWMSVSQIKAFNALIVLTSLFIGTNLTSSFRDYAMMMRWRFLSSKYRTIREFDLLLECQSLRTVMKLFWEVRTRGRAWFILNSTQWLCVVWLGVNIFLQVLVAVLGLTYNLDTSDIPARRYGPVTIANLTVIRDVWASEHTTFEAQLGAANSYGIQGQDYLFVEDAVAPGQDRVAHYGVPGTPTVYASNNWTTMTYEFQDEDRRHPNGVSLVSHRNISSTATCEAFRVLSGGNGSDIFVTYLESNGEPRTLTVARVGIGAMTYIGVLNSTCGPRCTEVMALQSSNGDTIPRPSFFKCQNTVSPVRGIDEYLVEGQSEWQFQMPDEQARIIAGAIGWSGFNYTPGDMYQYARYPLNSWWSPEDPADAGMIERRIMEFSTEALAAIDYNGPRANVTGWFAVPAQLVRVDWGWSGAILGLVPFVHLLALVVVIVWASPSVIRDPSHLSTARLLRPIVEKLGDQGCLLSGKEIANEFADTKVKYGWREPEPDFTFHNDIPQDVIRHVDILEEHEGHGLQGVMPQGLYDGLYRRSGRRECDCERECEDHEEADEQTRLLRQTRSTAVTSRKPFRRRSMSL